MLLAVWVSVAMLASLAVMHGGLSLGGSSYCRAQPPEQGFRGARRGLGGSCGSEIFLDQGSNVSPALTGRIFTT